MGGISGGYIAGSAKKFLEEKSRQQKTPAK
jgi:hypothetical protein